MSLKSTTDIKSEDTTESISIPDGAGSAASLASIDVKQEAKLRRKLDLTIMPIVTLCYTLMFLDRGNIGNARSAGLVTDLRLRTYDFNIGACLFYVAYLLFEIPFALLVKRVGFVLVPISIVCFGLVTMASAYMHDRLSFFGCRIALGITEAVCMPGISYLLTRYYRRHELTSRVGFFMLFAGGAAGGFGGLLAAGLLKLGRIGTRHSWQNIFFVEGILTVGLGLILIPIFPTDPERTRIFNEEERQLAVARILVDQPQVTTTKEKMSLNLVKRGVLNVTTLACVWIHLVANLSVQGLGVFLPSIIKLNYPQLSVVGVQLLVAPVWVASAAAALGVSILCIRHRMHWPFCLMSSLLGIVGYGIWIATDASSPQARYAACFFNLTSGLATGVIAVGWAGSNASPDTIRALVGAVVTGLGGIGSISGVWAYVQTDAASGYRKGNSFNLAMSASVSVGCVLLFVYQKLENRKRANGGRQYRLEKGDVQTLGNLHPSFRYIH